MRYALKTARWLSENLYVLYRPIYFLYKLYIDRHEVRLMRACIRRGDTTLDIGANIGFHSRLLASLVGTDGRVYAFEPAPQSHQRLVDNTRHLKQVVPIHAAASSYPGTAKVYLSKELNVDDRTYATETHRPSTEVPTVRVDEHVPYTREVSFVKMDIQGSEADALQGMRRILTGNDRLVVICECCPKALQDAGSSADLLIETLQSAGLTTKVMLSNGLLDACSILQERHRWNEPYFYRNLIAYNPSQQPLMERLFKRT